MMSGDVLRLRQVVSVAALSALAMIVATATTWASGDTPGGPKGWIEAPNIALAAPVVQAQMVTFPDGSVNWPVPAYSAGHLQYTAEVGQRGNAVLIGHISSIAAGNVFANLSKMSVGDEVTVYNGEQPFTYQVQDVTTVPREAVGVLADTSSPTLTLITCAGDWIPSQRDFTERLIVRAQLR